MFVNDSLKSFICASEITFGHYCERSSVRLKTESLIASDSRLPIYRIFLLFSVPRGNAPSRTRYEVKAAESCSICFQYKFLIRPRYVHPPGDI